MLKNILIKTMLLEILTIISNTAVLSIVGYVLFNYLKIKRKVKNILYKMDASEILNENNEYKEYSESVVSLKRERLFAIVSGGMSKQYLGKEFQVSDIDKMDDSQVSKLYCRYEARLGASMTKTLGNSLINLYVFRISKYFSVPEPPKLIQELEEDPFINNALNSTCCELYYKYGMYLAPFTAMITTAKHISFNKEVSESENIDIKNE